MQVYADNMAIDRLGCNSELWASGNRISGLRES